MKRILVFLLFTLMIFTLIACNNVPEQPNVQGVQAGEIYGNPVQIDLKQREENVDYIATIDEDRYELGSRYKEEGKHTLKIVASRDDESSQTTIPFEIDTIPPKTPKIAGVKDKGTYYKSVQINLEKKDGVTYEFMIDGSNYELNTQVTEEGKHVFKVIATKDRNNLTTEETVTFTIDNSTYTQEEVEYFTEIALGSEYGGSSVVKKWLSDVKIKVGGNPTQADLDTIRKVAGELDNLIPTLTLDIVEQGENINMYFVPQGDFQEYIDDAALGNWAYFRYDTSGTGEIDGAKITIGTFGSNQSDRNHHIREELTQALGMGNDSLKYEDSIFYENHFSGETFSELDKKVIEILYRKDIKIGMNKKEVIKTLSERITDE